MAPTTRKRLHDDSSAHVTTPSPRPSAPKRARTTSSTQAKGKATKTTSLVRSSAKHVRVCDKLFLSETYPSSIVSASVDSLVHLYPSSERLSRRSAQRCISNLAAAHYCSCYDILKDNYFKVCDSRILTLAVHPTAMLAACGDKRGNIGLLRGLDEQKPESCMGTTWDRAHGAGVTGMEWKHDSNMFTRNLVSCSSDGRLLDCDVENQHSTLLFADHGSEFSALGRSASSDFFVVGNRTGCIAGLDVDRTPGPVWAIESEYRRVSSISFHPVLENVFAVSSERFIRVWDCRHMKRALSETLCEKAPFSLRFNPTGTRLAALTRNNDLFVWKKDPLQVDQAPDLKVEHNNDTGRWLSQLQLTWLPDAPNVLAVPMIPKINLQKVIHCPSAIGFEDGEIKPGGLYRAAHSPTQLMDSDTGRILGNMFSPLAGAVSSMGRFHPTLPVYFSTSASGYCFMWTRSDRCHE